MKKDDAKKPRWTYWHTATFTAVLPFFNFAASALHGGWDKRYAAASLLLAVSCGLLGGLLHYKRCFAWLTSVLIGLFLTLFSVIRTLAGPPFAGEVLINFMFSVFYFSFFMVIGAVAEIIRSVHRAVHFDDDRI